MADTEIPEGLPEINRALVDADEIYVGKFRATITRLVTYISSKFSAGTGLTKTGEAYSITAAGVGTTQLAGGAATFAKIQDVGGCSVPARAANSTGVLAAVAAASDNILFARVAGVLTWVRATMAMLAPFPSASIYRTGAAQSIASGGAATIVDFDTTLFNTGGSDAPTIDLVTNNRITIVKDGLYRITGGVQSILATSVAAGSFIEANIFVTGVQTDTDQRETRVVGQSVCARVTRTLWLVAGNYVDLRVFQNTGVAQSLNNTANVRPFLEVVYDGPAT